MVLITDPLLEKMYEQTLPRFQGTMYDMEKGDSFTVPFGQEIVHVKSLPESIEVSIPTTMTAKLRPIRLVQILNTTLFSWELFEDVFVFLVRRGDAYVISINIADEDACNLLAWALNKCEHVSHRTDSPDGIWI